MTVQFGPQTSIFAEEVDEKEIPGISELRNLDAKYSNCCVWEVADPPKVRELYEKKARHRTHIIKFGSPTDRMVWSVTRLAVLADLMLVPFVIAFEYVYPLHANRVVHMTDGLITFLYMVCVLQAFYTTYVDPKEMVEVKDPLKIQTHVMCSPAFMLDILSIGAAPALYTHTHLRWFAVLRLLKCRRLMQDKTRVMLLDDAAAIVPKLASIVLVVYAAAHLYACAWFKAKVISARGFGHEWTAFNGWSQDVFDAEHVDLAAFSLPIEPGDLTDLLVCYCRALRDGCFMVVTWGSPNALSFVELGTLIVLGPIISCVMAYVFGYIVTIIGNATTMQDRLSKQMHVLNAACKELNVQTSLHLRICRYHSYKLAHHMDADAQTLFDELSPNLASETRVYRMRHMILSADVFQGLTPRLILILLSTSTEHLFSPGDLIVRRGEIADCMYIVMNGILSVLAGAKADVLVKKLHENQMFGEACFLSDKEPRMAFVRAETFAVLSRFDRDAFEQVMMGHADLKDHIKDAILRTMNKYKAARPSMADQVAESADKSASSDEREAAVRSSWLSLQSEQLAAHDPTTSYDIRDLDEVDGLDAYEKEKQELEDEMILHPTVSLNGILARTQKGHAMVHRSQSRESNDSRSVVVPVTNGSHHSDDRLETDIVHKTDFETVHSTTSFRVSASPASRERSRQNTEKTPGKKSCVKQMKPTSDAAELSPEQSNQKPLSLQSEAQQAARQALTKFSLGRAVQREAVSFLKEHGPVAEECRPLLSNCCEALLGQLMCLEVAQKRLEGMINVP